MYFDSTHHYQSCGKFSPLPARLFLNLRDIQFSNANSKEGSRLSALSLDLLVCSKALFCQKGCSFAQGWKATIEV